MTYPERQLGDTPPRDASPLNDEVAQRAQAARIYGSETVTGGTSPDGAQLQRAAEEARKKG